MTLDADNVRVAITGAVRTAVLGTALPTNPTAAYGVGYVDLGYVGEDGVTETPSSSWNEIRAWQNRAIVRRTLQESNIEFGFTLIESKQETLEMYHPGSAMEVAAGVARLPVVAPKYDPRVWAFDVIDGSTLVRIIIPKGVVTETGAIVYNGTDPIGYELKVEALDSGTVDAAGQPIYANKYSNDPAWAEFSS